MGDNNIFKMNNQLNLSPFHLAIQVRNLKEARKFYGSILDCEEGRSSSNWIDFNFYGHQLVCHLNKSIGENNKIKKIKNSVDFEQIPVPHFGVVLSMDAWNNLSKSLLEKKISFIIKPTVRFKGTVGEQATMFFEDPSGNALEFKAFNNIKKQLFFI